jgi:hypothetical protein
VFSATFASDNKTTMLNWTQLLLIELPSFQPMVNVGEFLLVGLLVDMK